MQDGAPGMVFWHPRGWSVYTALEEYMRQVQRANGYQEIRTPQIVDRSLWERSGHWDKFRENMFAVESESRDLDRKSTRLNSSHVAISYAVFCLKTKK